MKRLFLLLPLVALAGCKDPQDGVKVVISYGQFVPGCVRVTATDDASGDTRTTDVAVREKKPEPNSQIVVGVLLPEKWGTAITVEANGYEALPKDGACVGNAVTNQRKGLSVPKGSTKDGKPAELTLLADARDADGDGYVSNTTGGSDCNDSRESTFPGAPKLCGVADNDCNDLPDDQELGINGTCTGQTGCAGTVVCNTATGAAVCNSPDPIMAWADEDGDKHGDKNKPEIAVCAPALPANRIPSSFPHDDCDDSKGNVNPEVVEICDGLDNNCDGTDDNLPPEACQTPLSLCDGHYVCAPGGKTCAPNNPVPTWYPDGDGDNYGRDADSLLTCVDPNGGAVKYVNTGGDCNDGNPFTHPNAAELCDEEDNSCNGMADEAAACSNATPTWAQQAVGPNTSDWYAIALYDGGGVWFVGSDSARAVRKSYGKGFDILPGKCTAGTSPQSLFSVWAHPQTGKAYIGRDAGKLYIQEPTSQDCSTFASLSPSSDTATTTGLVGFVSGSSLQLYGTAARTTPQNNGYTFTWDGSPSITVTPTTQPGVGLQQVHGNSPSTLFSVGDKGGNALILRYNTGNSTWSELPAIANAKALNSVWVVNDRLAYAVGKQGTFLKWDGNTWTLGGGPTSTENLTGVLAFGSTSIYVISELGMLHRYNGTQWTSQAISPTASIYGIRGTSPEDIWVVGRFGTVFHYPVWPPVLP